MVLILFNRIQSPVREPTSPGFFIFRMIQIDSKLREPADPELQIECIQCTGSTAHAALATVDAHGDEGPFEWHNKHQIVQCLGCKSMSYRVVSTNSEDYFHDEYNEVHYDETVKLFPPRGAKGMGDASFYLPQKVREIYAETLTALTNSAPVLAAIGLRALVEAVCKEKDAAGRSLLAQVDSLVEKGVTTPQGAGILHRIRTMGNDAAHEVKPHTERQLSVALDIVEHMLKDVYILPRQVEDEFSAQGD
jgi:hypothetical protein